MAAQTNLQKDILVLNLEEQLMGNRKRDVWQGTVCSDRSGNLLCGINSDKETDGSI